MRGSTVGHKRGVLKGSWKSSSGEERLESREKPQSRFAGEREAVASHMKTSRQSQGLLTEAQTSTLLKEQSIFQSTGRGDREPTEPRRTSEFQEEESHLTAFITMTATAASISAE
jgi:hypothetical protein